MRVEVCDADRGAVVRRDRAVDLRAFAFDATIVADAVRAANGADSPLSVDCPDPGPAHEHVGAITPDRGLARRAALAAAARSRGRAAPQDADLAAVRERLDALDPPSVDLRAARERAADASDAEAELRERVASLRGRVRALREVEDAAGVGASLADAEDDLEAATRRLSEVETERIAAEQALARARERAREARETRRERLRLEDRAGNLRRAAREHLADWVADDFEAALESVPEGVPSATVRDALAVARVAALDAPVALAGDADPFGSAEAAARWLDAPVVLV